MFDMFFTFSMFAKVVIAFCVIYIVMPYIVIDFGKKSHDLFDTVFISLTKMSLASILLVHALSFLHLYEYMSAIIAFISLSAYLVWKRKRRNDSEKEAVGMRLFTHYIEIMDDRNKQLLEIKTAILRNLKGWVGSLLEFFKELARQPVDLLLIIIILLVSAYVRLRHSLYFSNYTFSDPYFHLLWIKYIGNNEIYHDGIYSQGYHTMVSLISKVFFIDPYWIIRFFGPLGGILLILSIFYFVLKITQDKMAATLSILLIGIVKDANFPNGIERQTAALPQEFGAIFIFPGIYFFWEYLKSRDKHYMHLFLQAIAVTFLIHPFSTVYMLIICAFELLFSFVFMKLKIKEILKMAAFGFAYMFFAVLPFIIGFLSGKTLFQDSARFIGENIGGEIKKINFINAFIETFSTNPILSSFLIMSVFIIVLSFVFNIHNKGHSLYFLIINWALAFSGIVITILYKSNELGLPTITSADRTGFFLSLVVACLAGVMYNQLRSLLSAIFNSRVIVNSIFKSACVLLCAAAMLVYPFRVQGYAPMEYDEAARNYIEIKERFPAADWTIIAPTEQLQQAYSYGQHMEVLRLVQKYTAEQVGKKEFVFEIPTSHIFFYIEKIPFGSTEKITTRDANRELEPEGGNPYKQYYLTTSQRTVVEAKALRLMEEYEKTHNNIDVFYESDNLRIYHVDNSEYMKEYILR